MRIVLGVSGGIAAYKAPELVRRLRERGAEVRAILTPNAERFVSPLSIAAVSGFGVIIDQWGDPSSGGVDHIEIARWADLLLIAPATANVIGKLAAGIADDALTTYAIAHRGRVVIAPAMNTFMLQHVAVQSNIALLQSRGVSVIAPTTGELACGEVGEGKMPDPAEIVRELFPTGPLSGLRVVITAGPTREAIDPVRYLTNRSSGRMGYALAAEALARGAEVTLISGPVALQSPAGANVTSVTTAGEMYDATIAAAAGADVVIGAAAVADYETDGTSAAKIRRSEDGELVLRLKPTRDILRAVAALERRPFVVAFAAETEDLLGSARRKLERKGADLIVANDVSDPSIGFDAEQNRVVILSRSGEQIEEGPAPKREIAARILDAIAARVARTDHHPAVS